MLIRWTFSLTKDQALSVDIREPAEDKRIRECIDSVLDWLYIPGTGNEAYINLHNCNAIVRQEIDEQAQSNNQTQAVENKETAIPLGSENNPA